MIQPLSRTENKILRMLSNGLSYEDAGERIGFRPELVHAYTYRIRKKTGIVNTRDPQECKAWFSGVSYCVKTNYRCPSRSQLSVMALLAEGKSYREIAEKLEIKQQTAQNHAHRGCAAAGLTGKGHFRTAAIRDYLAGLKNYPHAPVAPQPDPLDAF